MSLNRFTRAFRDFYKGNVLEEKWLLAPSLRVGFQWMDRVARSGQPVLNVRVKTLLHTALELASGEMQHRKLDFLRGMRHELLIHELFGRLKAKQGGYLASLDPSAGLTRTLKAAIRDLRLAGVRKGALGGKSFEVENKGKEIRFLLAEYEKELEARDLVDYAGVLRMAADRLRRDPQFLPQGTVLIMPEDMEEDLRGLERAFWETVPEQKRAILPVDRPGELPEGDRTDAGLLAWLEKPGEAPRPVEDGSVEMFRAVGEVNEVREVFRRCLEEKIPLDEVEIVHTDIAMYVPLIYEMAWSLASKEDQTQPPVSFSEGIPPRYSRPGRALMGCLAWINEDYPQSVLVRMIQDGLFRIEAAERERYSYNRLGELFRTVPVGNGRGRYVPALDAAISGLEKRAGRLEAGSDRPADDEDSTREQERVRVLERAEGLKEVRKVVKELFVCLPVREGSGSDQRQWLQGMREVLERHARRVNEFDEYCKKQLTREIREVEESLEEGNIPGLDVRRFLSDLPQSSHVGGLGPRPGCLFVTPVHLGGHSGRRHTFILGLDDSRFPGAGLQDPVLLDGERSRISPDLSTVASRLEKKTRDFARLLARLRGRVSLSYCCRSLADDREMFPSPALVSAFRIVSGKPQGDLEDLRRRLRHPVSFAPSEPERCADPVEWWLWRTCSRETILDPEEVLSENFPGLGRGFEARRARESDCFTEYDGYVPEAGIDHDPFKPDGTVLSANRLERLGACPMEYFFKYVLKIEPPEEHGIDPGVWLDPLQKGTLLHEVFREFMSRLHNRERPPAFHKDLNEIQEILEKEIARWKEEQPPPNPDVFQQETRLLKQTCRIFLREEEIFCRESRPLYFEASMGLPSEGDGTDLDTGDPVEVVIPGGKTVRVRGRIDRVDEELGSQGKRFSIWDYKTGGSWKYTVGQSRQRQDPFDQGRVVQNALYLAMVESRLRQVLSPESRVARFGYFFPGIREHGERVQWEAGELAHGMYVLERLCALLAAGCFPFTDKPGDVRFSDFAAAFGDPEQTAGTVARKLANPDNEMLAPLQELRGYEEEDGKG